MKNKIPILLISVLILLSCAQKPVTVKIPINIENRVPFEKFEIIFIGGFDITSAISDPNPKKEMFRFFIEDFKQAINKRIEIVDIGNGSVPKIDSIKKKLMMHPNSLFITGTFTIDIKTRSIVKDAKKKKKFVKIQIWEMALNLTMIDSISLKTIKQMTLESKMKDADPRKAHFNFKSLFDNLTDQLMQKIRKRYKFQTRFLLKDRT